MEIDIQLKQLQNQLAMVDFLTEPHPAKHSDFIELLLVKLQDMKLKMYQEAGHQTPHIHIDYGKQNHAASYSITERRRLAGTLDTKYDRAIMAWVNEHNDKLMEVWQILQLGKDPGGLIGELTGND